MGRIFSRCNRNHNHNKIDFLFIPRSAVPKLSRKRVDVEILDNMVSYLAWAEKEEPRTKTKS